MPTPGYRFIFDMPDDLRERLRVYAFEQRRPMSEIVREIVDANLPAPRMTRRVVRRRAVKGSK